MKNSKRNKLPVYKAFLLLASVDYQATVVLLHYLHDHKYSSIVDGKLLFPSVKMKGTAFFMLLQMCVEKLSKAAYCKARGIEGKLPPKDHDFVMFFETVLARSPSFLGFWDRHETTFRFLREEINPRQPSNASSHSENLEYPWIDKHGRVKCPVNDLSLTRKYLSNPLNHNIFVFMRDIKELLESFDSFFYGTTSVWP